jgi:superfamily II helicase
VTDTATTCAWCGSTDDVAPVSYHEAWGRQQEILCANCKATQLVRRKVRSKHRRKATARQRATRAALVALSLLVFLFGVAAALQSWLL